MTDRGLAARFQPKAHFNADVGRPKVATSGLGSGPPMRSALSRVEGPALLPAKSGPRQHFDILAKRCY
jgi:hypothetical protein